MRRSAVLAVAFFATLPGGAAAERVTPPSTPGNLQVAEGNKAFLAGHAVGTQNYICLPLGSGFGWSLFGPQATLFEDNDRQVITHFLSPNPDENDTPRATWQHSKDTSAVWAMAIASSTDASFVAPGAIPWLLLRVVGGEPGRDGGEKLSDTTYIHRLNTGGGAAPATGCAEATEVGSRVFVPYTADYYFYKAARGPKGEDD
jgi:hypothetical protein